ncbi:MAG: PhnD/SsuA/transferrin family substrate-binding protein [Chloroflexi bacterium]|nr:PhnD/SsuA/transferrin family substrate-binding protein [Chloroflexota bacterium]
MSKSNYARLTLVIVCLLALAACREEAPQNLPVASAPLTPTPLSTPLPAVPTLIPAGAEGNPIRLVVRPRGPAADARNATADVEASILEQSGLSVQVEIVERYAEALAALCDSAGGQVSAAWLDAPTYMAARAQNCGIPVLQIEQGTRQDARSGEAGLIIVAQDSSIRDVRGLDGRTFCRLGYDDFYSWLAPSLVMRANGLDPVSAPEAVVDYADVPELIEAVAGGDCDAAGIAESALEEYAGALGDVVDSITALATTTSFPYGVLVMPDEIPLGVRLSLTETLQAMSEDNVEAVKLRALLAQSALVSATADDFTEMVDFMDSTGLDFALLGG